MESLKFNAAIKKTLEWEGGYVNDPKDAGGETKYGISKRAHPNYIISLLTIEEATDIYRKGYWNDYYDLAPMPIVFKVFDMGVLFGVKVAVKLLQESIIIVGKKTIKADGVYGPITAAAIAACALEEGKAEKIYEDFKKRLVFRIYWIILKKPFNYKFRNGWLRRINDNPFDNWSL